MADHHEEEHGGAHVGPDVHLPDPSVWPLVVGIAFFLVGAALVWWARDPDNSIAGPFIGAAVAVALVATAGWAYEDGRMKRQAEEHEEGHPRNARFTQVITFAIADGQFATANSSEGVLHKIEASDSDLRNLAGFQDLRIIASPADTGTSQVLVETTWADREGLATYDETRQTVLDTVNEFTDQVVPGSVQVFDMVVVRDTKDVSMRFGTGTAATLIGGLAIGGFLIGAGMTLFEGEGTAGTGNGVAPPTGFEETGIIVARNTRFLQEAIALPPDTELTLALDNQDASPPHNIEFFAGEDVSAGLLSGCISGCGGGASENEVSTPIGGEGLYEFTFVTPGPGVYLYHCVLHPAEMTGFLTVEEGAPIPGGGSAPPENGNGEDGNGEDGNGEDGNGEDGNGEDGNGENGNGEEEEAEA